VKGSDLTLKIAQIWLNEAKSSLKEAAPEPLTNSNRSFAEFCLKGYEDLPKTQTWNTGGLDSIEDGDHISLRIGNDSYDAVSWKSAVIGVLPQAGDNKEKKLAFRVVSPKDEWTGFVIDLVKKGYREATNYAFKLLIESSLGNQQGKDPQLTVADGKKVVEEIFNFVSKNKTASLNRPFSVEKNVKSTLEDGDIVLFPVDGNELYGVCSDAATRDVIVLSVSAGIPALKTHKAPEGTVPAEKGTKMSSMVAKKSLEDFVAFKAVCVWTGRTDQLMASSDFTQYCLFSDQPRVNRVRSPQNKKEKENEAGDALISQKQADGNTYTGFFAGDAIIGVVPQGAKRALCFTKASDPLWTGSKIAAKNHRAVLQLAYDLYLQDSLGLNEGLSNFLKQTDASSKFVAQVTALTEETLNKDPSAANPYYQNGNVLKARNAQGEFVYGVFAFSSIITVAPAQGQKGKWQAIQDSPAADHWTDASLVYKGQLKTALKALELFQNQGAAPISSSKTAESSSKEFANKSLGRNLIK